MANQDHDGPAADQAADQGVRDEAAGAQPGAGGRGSNGIAGAGSDVTAARDAAEPERQPAAGQAQDEDAGPEEVSPPGRSAENAPYLPPGPNPFPSAYPPAQEPAYDPQALEYQDYADGGAEDWYYDAEEAQQPYPDAPYAQPQYRPGYYPGAGPYGPPGYPGAVPPGYQEPPPGYPQAPPGYQGPPPDHPGGAGPEMEPFPVGPS